jgi:hypothetical protein
MIEKKVIFFMDNASIHKYGLMKKHFINDY